jgi:hypothetical protein
MSSPETDQHPDSKWNSVGIAVCINLLSLNGDKKNPSQRRVPHDRPIVMSGIMPLMFEGNPAGTPETGSGSI